MFDVESFDSHKEKKNFAIIIILVNVGLCLLLKKTSHVTLILYRQMKKKCIDVCITDDNLHLRKHLLISN